MDNKLNFSHAVFFKTDEDGNIVSEKNIITRSITDNLDDGLYVMYRGTDWVFGNDTSLLYAKLVQEGQSDHYTNTFTKQTTSKKTVNMGAEFSYSFLKLAISQAYETTISDSVTKSFTVDFTSPSGDTYFKLYATYKRYDVVRVKNGQITHSGTTYEFVGSRTTQKNVPAGQGDTIDTNSLVIAEDQCLLTPVDNSIWQIIDSRDGNIVTGRNTDSNIFNLNQNMSFNTFTYTSPSCVELYFIFNITEASTYVFLTGSIVNLTLYSLNINSGDKITKHSESLADNTNDTYISTVLSAGNYVIKLSTNNDISNKYSLQIQKQ